MLGLIWGVFTWLRSFIRSRHDLGLEIVALRQQVLVLKRRNQAGPLAPFGPIVLGSAAPSVAAVGESSFDRETEHSHSVAPGRLPSVLALSLPTQTAWQASDPVRGSGCPPDHCAREPYLGSSTYPLRAAEAQIRDFRANRLAIPFANASPRWVCSTLANLSEEPPGVDCRDGFLHRHYGKLPGSILLIPDSVQSPRDHPLECDRPPYQ